MKTLKYTLFILTPVVGLRILRVIFYMKNFHKAVKEYKFYKSKPGFNPTLLYNFLSNRYWVTLFYSKNILKARFYKSHEVII